MKKYNQFLSSVPRRLRLIDYEFGKILGEGKKNYYDLI